MSARFTDLVGCRLPIQQAGMGGGIAGAELAAAVSRAGALGTVGLGGGDGVAAQLEQVAKMAMGLPFAVNFLVPFLVRDAVAYAGERARIVEFFWGDPDPSLVALVHAGGAAAAWQVGSVAEARQAADAGCDIVVLQGVEAGGHVRGTIPLRSLLNDVRAELRDPLVVASGGIGTPDEVTAALNAGADAVRVGTPFIAAVEANAHPDYVAALIAASADDTVLTETFALGWPDAPHRVLRSCIGDGSPRSAAPPNRDTTAPVDRMALYAGTSVEHVRAVELAATIVDRLASGIDPA